MSRIRIKHSSGWQGCYFCGDGQIRPGAGHFEIEPDALPDVDALRNPYRRPTGRSTLSLCKAHKQLLTSLLQQADETSPDRKWAYDPTDTRTAAVRIAKGGAS